MALWLGIMKVAENAGLMRVIARAIRPVMIRLFPDVPAEHPAMSAMIMNMAANMLGLGNAATPMGIKAMTELDKINPEKGTATNAMCLFLAINTSSVTILPLGVIAVRAAAGATEPASILVPSILATTISTTVAIVAAKLMSRKSPLPVVSSTEIASEVIEETQKEPDLVRVGLVPKIFAIAMIPIFLYAIPHQFIQFNFSSFPHNFITFKQVAMSGFQSINAATAWLIPLIMGGLLLLGYLRV
jgi:spore maturation protein SpmA